MKRLITLFFLLACVSFLCAGQKKGFEFIGKKKKAYKFPFKLINNTPIIPVHINGSDTLFFVLDTGLGTTLITELTHRDSLDLRYANKILLSGLGEGKPLEAIKSFHNTLKVGNIIFHKQTINVLTYDIFSLSKVSGTKVNGIIGYSVFKDLIVEIDYQNGNIIFHNPAYYNNRKSRRTVEYTLELMNKKPFIKTFITTQDGDRVPVKLLIDTGASLSLWLSAETHKKIDIPAKNIPTLIGQGLSGNIYGKVARIKSLEIGHYTLHDIITSFPDSTSVKWMNENEHRNGSIGGEILRRFRLIIDYPNKKVSFTKNRYFNTDFDYNLSGIELRAPYPNLPIYNIYHISEDSPAEEAGLRKDDQILEINNMKTMKMSLTQVVGIFSNKKRPKIKLKIMRDGKILEKAIVLKSRI